MLFQKPQLAWGFFMEKAGLVSHFVLHFIPSAGIAQLVEQLICNHQVASSTLAAGTISS
jgi:hypothetical protein